MSEEHMYSNCFSGVAAGCGKACSDERLKVEFIH
jgi:hypothetical protein